MQLNWAQHLLFRQRSVGMQATATLYWRFASMFGNRVRRSLTRSQGQHAAATVFLLAFALVCLLVKNTKNFTFGVHSDDSTIQQYSTEMRFHGSCY